MNAVVPKIRVGDVLLGTKNLRNYIRTCSQLRYLNHLSRKRKGLHNIKTPLYTPNKQDKFIVAVNNNTRFAVWSSNQNVILFFGNSPSSPEEFKPVMDREIFAQWFLKTPGRNPNVSDWPIQAHFLWASIHKNAVMNPNKRLIFKHPPLNLEDKPFIISSSIRYKEDYRKVIQQGVREAIHFGNFKKKFKYSNACGPKLDDLPKLREGLKYRMEDTRIATEAKNAGIDLNNNF